MRAHAACQTLSDPRPELPPTPASCSRLPRIVRPSTPGHGSPDPACGPLLCPVRLHPLCPPPFRREVAIPVGEHGAGRGRTVGDHDVVRRCRSPALPRCFAHRQIQMLLPLFPRFLIHRLPRTAASMARFEWALETGIEGEANQWRHCLGGRGWRCLFARDGMKKSAARKRQSSVISQHD